MKTIVSLISLLQFLALCQFGFALFGAGYNYKTHLSDIVAQIGDAQASKAVVRWHEDTVETAKTWSIAMALLTFTSPPSSLSC